MIRRWHLNTESFDDNSNVSITVLEEAKRKTKNLLNYVGVGIDFVSIYHMLLGGMALGYIIILYFAESTEELLSFFVHITRAADYFFYVSSFFIFVGMVIFAGVLHITKSGGFQEWAIGVCAILILCELFATTYSLPMSLMVAQQVNDNGEWYESSLAVETFGKLVADSFRPLALFRMLMILITSPINALCVSNSRYTAWKNLVDMI